MGKELHVCTISKEIEFDAGHRVPKHKSKCFSPHGHRYKVRMHLRGTIVDDPGASDDGMLMDFGDLKTIMQENIHDVLDHGMIVYYGDDMLLDAMDIPSGDTPSFIAQARFPVDFVWPNLPWRVIVFPYVPTAENIARWIWETNEAEINEHFRGNLQLEMVTVYETPTSVAYYDGETVEVVDADHG